jgi:branched-chain amino acid transport system permease protein
MAAAVGIVFGLPSLRIRGFYSRSPRSPRSSSSSGRSPSRWFTNYSSSGVITAQPMEILGTRFDTPQEKYLLVLGIVALMALAAKNMTRGNIGRQWMAIRDMDVAAEVIGIRPMRAKLLAFAVSSFYCGVAGALYAYAYLGTVEPEAYSLDLSFRILFMIIIGGVGTILGAFLGSAFIVVLPIRAEPVRALPRRHAAPRRRVERRLERRADGVRRADHLLPDRRAARARAHLQITKEKLRLWPFPH